MNNNNKKDNKKDNEKDNKKDNEKDNEKNSLKKEIKRIWKFMKNNKNIVFITILFIFLFYLSSITIENNIFNNNINIIKKNLKGGSSGGNIQIQKNASKSLFKEYTFFQLIRGDYYWDKYDDNEGIVYFYKGLRDAWIIRPTKFLLFFIAAMFAISGSFMAPLIIYGILFYFLLKKFIKYLFPINIDE